MISFFSETLYYDNLIIFFQMHSFKLDKGRHQSELFFQWTFEGIFERRLLLSK